MEFRILFVPTYNKVLSGLPVRAWPVGARSMEGVACGGMAFRVTGHEMGPEKYKKYL